MRQSLKELLDAQAAVISSWSESGRLVGRPLYHSIFTIWWGTQHDADFNDQVQAIIGRQLVEEEF